jgi:nitrogen fixation NifU-like protein
MSLEMYQQNILDHYKHPRNFGDLKDANAHAHVSNPLCGDELDFYLKFDRHGKLTDVKFSGRGCAISIAAASMLTEKLQNLEGAEVTKLVPDDVLTMLGVQIVPARMKCATLALEAVQQAVGHH